ncbi:hypothetical protein [Helicobacter sp. MIT 14-3879]|uniref:hypothetical protein n=1 Tax=Helicobacter sp. MIT 14-3879 TaxID=2040649 RepID=UPI000E1F56FD|nr:hypothetical protein [Helicobacter sp. MIT 14-3879]RDU59031.1 hypothetical protein CQA44_11785 [Helicobacter sp. MIT 14-3879]
MIYIILAIFGFFILYVICGGHIYYPTSYRAFIPKQWDSEYKEYQKLCKENIGRVVYARVITQKEREEMEEILKTHITSWLCRVYYIPINKNIYELRYTLYTLKNNTDSIAYQQIVGYHFNRNWTEFIFFTKGSPIDEKFYKTEMRDYNIQDDIFLNRVFNNQQNIGIKEDININGKE